MVILNQEGTCAISTLSPKRAVTYQAVMSQKDVRPSIRIILILAGHKQFKKYNRSKFVTK